MIDVFLSLRVMPLGQGSALLASVFAILLIAILWIIGYTNSEFRSLELINVYFIPPVLFYKYIMTTGIAGVLHMSKLTKNSQGCIS